MSSSSDSEIKVKRTRAKKPADPRKTALKDIRGQLKTISTLPDVSVEWLHTIKSLMLAPKTSPVQAVVSSPVKKNMNPPSKKH
jgi:hypothetical protein